MDSDTYFSLNAFKNVIVFFSLFLQKQNKKVNRHNRQKSKTNLTIENNIEHNRYYHFYDEIENWSSFSVRKINRSTEEKKHWRIVVINIGEVEQTFTRWHFIQKDWASLFLLKDSKKKNHQSYVQFKCSLPYIPVRRFHCLQLQLNQIFQLGPKNKKKNFKGK